MRSWPPTSALTVAALAAFAVPALVTPLAVAAQEVTLTGQVRPRFEFRDPVGGGLDDFTSMRTRLAIDAQIEPGLSVFIQTQDVRIWGEESHPLFDFSANSFDLHQGYLRFQGENSDWLTTTIGRMETNLGGQRLLGAVDWTQQGQSFDGARFDIRTGRTRWVLLGYTVNDDTAAGMDEEEDLFGVYGTLEEVGPGALDVYWLNDRISSLMTSDEHLVGARYAFTGAAFGRVEATFETGTRNDVDVSAYMFGGRLGKSFDDGRFTGTLWYDYLSGDDPATPEVEVFNTLYATNHKFYGFADLFLNIPVHTAGAGLQDMAVKLLYRPADLVTVGLDIHSFRAAEGAGLTDTHFGEELDLTLTHRYSDHLTAVFGFSEVFQADGRAGIGRRTENMTGLYVMLNATF
jgi:hypothetical protein